VDFFGPSPFRFGSRDSSFDSSNITVDEDGDTVIAIVAPGVNRKDFAVSFKDSILTVSLDVNQSPGKTRFAGSFTRAYRINRGVTSDDISATYRNGVLSVTIVSTQTQEDVKTVIPVQ
tara:strand:- start:14582 stop:14935 length:354 start_codon:yes stop_codon:yes gene_type:complete